MFDNVQCINLISVIGRFDSSQFISARGACRMCRSWNFQSYQNQITAPSEIENYVTHPEISVLICLHVLQVSAKVVNLHKSSSVIIFVSATL
jgi:hypothetical protein